MRSPDAHLGWATQQWPTWCRALISSELGSHMVLGPPHGLGWALTLSQQALNLTENLTLQPQIDLNFRGKYGSINLIMSLKVC